MARGRSELAVYAACLRRAVGFRGSDESEGRVSGSACCGSVSGRPGLLRFAVLEPPREPLRAECLVGIRVLPFLAREGRHTCAGLSPAGGQVVVGRERFGSSPLLFSCFELKITLMAK